MTTIAQHVQALLAIIMALAIGDLVMSFHRIMTARHRVVWYWPVFALAIYTLAVLTQIYWVDFYIYRDIKTMTIAQFAPDLGMRIVAFLTAASIFPDRYDDDKAIDLKAHYWSCARYFWSLILANITMIWIFYAPRTNAATDPVEFFNQWWGNIATTLIAITLIVSRRPWLHKSLILVLCAIGAENFYSQSIG